jgi:hypothetical protein
MSGLKMRYLVTVLSLILLIGFEGCIFDDILPLNAEIINMNSEGACDNVASVDLLTGDNKKVGSVTVSVNGDTLQVVFFTEPGVYIRFLRYHIGFRSEDFPQEGGSPVVDNFFYDETTKKILLSALTGTSGFTGNIYIAAFARIAYGEVLAEEGEVSIERTHRLGDPSYFLTTLSVSDIEIDYYGYCLQGDQLMDVDTTHTINLESSLSPDTSLLESVIDESQNIDLVNWVLNQQRSIWTRSDGEAATGADIQMAIWRLIESTGTPTGTYIQNKFDPNLVEQIVEEARLKGDGYRPVCGQKELIVLHKGAVGELSDKGNYNTGLYADPNYQVSGIVKTITCSDDERDSWAKGTLFPGGVGTFFGFCIN